MPTTNTERMRQISSDLYHDGSYTSANSVEAITVERDALVNAALPFCNMVETVNANVGVVTPEQVRLLRDAVSLAQNQSEQWIPKSR